MNKPSSVRARIPAPSWLSLSARWLRMAFLLLVASLAFAASGCAAAPRALPHSVSFDSLEDGSDSEVLDYRYGPDAGVRAPDWQVQNGKIRQQLNVNATMPVGPELYVKWRLRFTGQVFEETVDLRPLVVRDMTNQRLHFFVKGPQLYVYLVTNELRPEDTPASGPGRYHKYKVLTLYPTTSKN